MLKRVALLLVTSLLITTAGCRGDSNAPPPPRDSGGRVDAGGGSGDGGPVDMDAGGLPGDGGARTDAGADAGSDAGPPCPCPTLPATCTARPANDVAFSPAGGALGDQLFSVVACATTSLHVAFYENTWPCLVDALIARLDAVPALTVDVMIDDDQCPRVGGGLSCELSRLETHARVRIVDDARSGYMHHKFVIADGARVWVSSANDTSTSFCSDHNNAIIVDDATIVAAYETEFQRLFGGMSGPTAVRPAVVSAPYSLYFSPQTPIDMPTNWFTDLVARIGTATTSIDFVVFSFTRTEVSDALVAAHGRGVTVRGVVDGSALSDMPAMALMTAGVPLRVANVHDKSMVIDGAVVITGSPNWSANSWANDENSLWIANAAVAGVYRTEFDRVYAAARTP